MLEIGQVEWRNRGYRARQPAGKKAGCYRCVRFSHVAIRDWRIDWRRRRWRGRSRFLCLRTSSHRRQ